MGSVSGQAGKNAPPLSNPSRSDPPPFHSRRLNSVPNGALCDCGTCVVEHYGGRTGIVELGRAVLLALNCPDTVSDWLAVCDELDG